MTRPHRGEGSADAAPERVSEEASRAPVGTRETPPSPSPCERCGGTQWGVDIIGHSDWRQNERCACGFVRRKAAPTAKLPWDR